VKQPPNTPHSELSVDDDLGFALPAPAKPGKIRVAALVLLAAACVTAGFFFAYLPRREQTAMLARDTRSSFEAAPSVEVVTPKAAPSLHPITLPASLQPLAETVLYPRANGYIDRVSADIGDRVKEGQLLALIETPELDQQLDQARAQLLQVRASLGQAEARRDYAKTSLRRYQQLRPAGVASQQELDEKAADERVSEANVGAAAASVEVSQADVRRLMQLKSFARVTAPFAGIITLRSVERGSLVSAGNSTPLFKLSATDPMRVFIQVPQALAAAVRPGAKANVTLREYAGRTFEGTVTRAAGALDPTTRTMLTEVRLPNPNNELLAGMYAEASLALAGSHVVFELPATTLFNDAQGLRVAVVEASGEIHFRSVVLERDVGATVQIASGLRGDERVVKLASAALNEGSKVRVVQ
jgi:membrane fusion protein (multidrug efflux system)